MSWRDFVLSGYQILCVMKRLFIVFLLSALSLVCSDAFAQQDTVVLTDIDGVERVFDAGTVMDAGLRLANDLQGSVRNGYVGIAEISPSYVYGACTFSVGVDIINGYRPSPYFFIGLGVGARYVCKGPAYDSEEFQFPVYCDVRVSLMDYSDKVSPFIGFKAGAIIFGNSFDYMYGHAGVLIEPAVGLEIRLPRKHALWVALGTMSYWSDGYPEELEMSLRVGFSF